MSGVDGDLTVLAYRGSAEAFATDFEMDYSRESLAFVDVLMLTFAKDPLSERAVQLSALWDKNDCDWAMLALKQKGDSSQLLRLQQRIANAAGCYVMEACARSLGGTWAVKSGWFSGKTVGLQFPGDKSIHPAHFFQSRLPTQAYTDLAHSLGR